MNNLSKPHCLQKKLPHTAPVKIKYKSKPQLKLWINMQNIYCLQGNSMFSTDYFYLFLLTTFKS